MMSASEMTALVIQCAEVGIIVPFALWALDALFSWFLEILKGLKQ